eukprot:PhM_4_TR15481/c0_g1_i1/m.56124
MVQPSAKGSSNALSTQHASATGMVQPSAKGSSNALSTQHASATGMVQPSAVNELGVVRADSQRSAGSTGAQFDRSADGEVPAVSGTGSDVMPLVTEKVDSPGSSNQSPNTVDRLREEVQRLKVDLSLAKQSFACSLSEAKSNVAAAENREAATKKRLELANAQLEANRSESLQSMNNLLSRTSDELTDAREKLRDAERQIADLEEVVALSPRAARRSLAKRSSSIARALDSSNTSADDLKTALREVAENLAASREESKLNDISHNRVKELLSGEVREARQKIDTLRAENAQLARQLELARHREDTLVADVADSDAQRTLLSLRKQLDDSSTLNRNLHSRLSDSERSRATTEDQLAELNATHSRLQDDYVREQQSNLSNTARSHSPVNETVSSTLLDIDDVHRDITAVRLDSFARRQQALNAENDSLRSQLNDSKQGTPGNNVQALKAKVEAMQRQVAHLEQELKRTQERSRESISNLQKDLDDAATREHALATDLQVAEARASGEGATAMQALINNLTAELKDMRQRLSQAERRAAAANDDSSSVSTTNTPLPRKSTASRLMTSRAADVDVAEQSQSSGSKQGALGATDGNNNNSSDDRKPAPRYHDDDVKNTVITIADDLDAAHANIEELKLQHRRTTDQLRAEVEAAKAARDHILRELEAKKAELRRVKEREQEYVDSTGAASLSALNSTLRRHNEELESEAGHLALQNEKLRSQTTTLENDTKRLQNETDRLIGEVAGLREANKLLKHRSDVHVMRSLPDKNTTDLIGAVDEVETNVANLHNAASRHREDVLRQELDSLRATNTSLRLALDRSKQTEANATAAMKTMTGEELDSRDNMIRKLNQENERLTNELAGKVSLKNEIDRMKNTLAADYERKAQMLEEQRTNEVDALKSLVSQLETEMQQRGGDQQTKRLVNKIAILERQMQEQAALHESARAVRRGGGNTANTMPGPATTAQPSGGDDTLGFYMERERQWNEVNNLNKQLREQKSNTLAETNAFTTKLKTLAYVFETRPTLLRSLFEVYKLVAALPKTLNAFSRAVGQRQLPRTECLNHIEEILRAIDGIKEGNRWVISNLFTAYELQHLGASPSLFIPDGPRPTWKDVCLPDRYNRLWAYSNVTTQGESIPAPPGAPTTAAFAVNPRVSMTVSPPRSMSARRSQSTNYAGGGAPRESVMHR